MSIRVSWDTPDKTIIRQDYDADWSWEEFSAAFKRTAELAAEVDDMVGIIADTSGISQIPPKAIVHAARAVSQLPPNDQLVAIIVAPSPFVNTMVDLVARLTHYDVRFAATVAAARALIIAERERRQNSQIALLSR